MAAGINPELQRLLDEEDARIRRGGHVVQGPSIQPQPPQNPVDRARNWAMDTLRQQYGRSPLGERMIGDMSTALEFAPPVAAARGGYDIGSGIAQSDVGQVAQGALNALPEVGRAVGPAFAAALPVIGKVRSPTGKLLDIPGESTVWSDLAKTKHTIPVEKMQATQVPTGELAPRRIIEPADLQGRVLIGEMGDRTQAGHRLTSIGGRPLAFDVDLQGGPNYMRAGASQGPDRAIWASDKGQVSRIAKFADREANRLKGEPTLSYTAMGARGGDFSHMMSDAVLAQVAQGGIAKKDLAAFDKAMKAQQPDWKGLREIYSKPEHLAKVREQLLAPGAGDLRKAFAEESSLGTWTDKGFPDPGQTRFAITDPELLGTPTGASGYAFAKIDPGAKPILNPSRPHTTYPTQLGGSYVGGFERTVPLEVMYPSFVKEKREAGMRPEKFNRAFQIGNVSQLADQQWVDLMSRYLEQQRGRGP